jgi:D-threo-aldose 1-dehydrogenase
MRARPLGTTGLSVSPLCFGGGPLGEAPEAFHYRVPEERAIATVRRVLDSPITFLDTSAGYGAGESERRIGAALAQAGGVPDGVVVATKVDPDPDTGAFDGPAVRRSIEGSLERLGLNRIPLLYLHDPERISFREGMAPDGPVAELLRLREEGLAGHLGVAGGPVDLMAQYLRTGAFEALITHNRWTLVDRSADALLDEAAQRGIAVVNGAPFGGGILVKGSRQVTTYAYRDAPPVTLKQVREMESACAEHGVPLAAAALQFSMRDPRITSTIVGMTRPERVDETLRLVDWEISAELEKHLESLAAPSEVWLW